MGEAEIACFARAMARPVYSFRREGDEGEQVLSGYNHTAKSTKKVIVLGRRGYGDGAHYEWMDREPPQAWLAQAEKGTSKGGRAGADDGDGDDDSGAPLIFNPRSFPQRWGE